MTYVNPFVEMRRPKLENPEGELVTGAFDCQERGCYSTVAEARYLEEVKVLTWKCANGHISKIEGFRIE